jgi:hypothetical protein
MVARHVTTSQSDIITIMVARHITTTIKTDFTT